MIFQPQPYSIPDEPGKPFIDAAEIESILHRTTSPSLTCVEDVIRKSFSKQRLDLEETAILLNADGEARSLILESARRLKQEIYGNRIVLFAPLYIGNHCVNNCLYCGFRSSNRRAVRKTLSPPELVRETENLERNGHKRLILVYGEHPAYSPEFIAETARTVYSVKTGNGGEIRRVNINAAPLDTEGFRIIKEAGIGTYQIFQETYHPDTYRQVHPSGRKSDYTYRLTALDRAMEAGIDDVGIGALIGLHDWKFEVLAMVRHANHLEACFGVGPHTLSFPRIKRTSDGGFHGSTEIMDNDFIRMVAILRLSIPYTGLILTAREPAWLRDRLIEYGVTQIDGGTRLEIGGYSSVGEAQNLDKEQFELNDERSLSEIVRSLTVTGQIPSFCTACYRKGRTGEHFMEFSVNGFIKRFCSPNAVLTFAEYLEDHAPEEIRNHGWNRIDQEITKIGAADTRITAELRKRLNRIRHGQRDILF